MTHVNCVSCGWEANHRVDVEQHRCLQCGDILEAATTDHHANLVPDPRYANSLWRYKDRLPVAAGTTPVTLGEGMTPLHRCPQLDGLIPAPVRIWLKDETNNPTGSFKDRLVSVAITRAQEMGATVVTCASSGNAAASTAAYAARAGMESVVFVPVDTPPAKILQARAYGAHVVTIPGDYSNSYTVCEAVAKRFRWPNLTTTYLNPYGTAGLATVGFELAEQLAAEGVSKPHLVSVPLGSGPLLYGIDRGWRESHRGDLSATVSMLGVQAEGCAPIVAAFDKGDHSVSPWGTPTTFASGISDPLRGYPEDGTFTLRIIRRGGGSAVAVSDESIRWAAAQLAQKAGVLAEPTGAAALAGIATYAKRTTLPDRADVVVCVTGHAFKEPKHMPQPPQDAVRVDAESTHAIVAAPHDGGSDVERALERIHDQFQLHTQGA